MCLHCLRQLPRVSSNGDDFNLLHERLASTVAIERAAGYFHYYKESPYVKLIHQAKYSSRPVVARKIARRFARELSLDGFFDGIDMIVPVPLHRWKLMRRGYNQSDYIARGIADVTGIEVSHSLVASRGHATQTARNSYQRWVNAGSVYELYCWSMMSSPQEPRCLPAARLFTVSSRRRGCRCLPSGWRICRDGQLYCFCVTGTTVSSIPSSSMRLAILSDIPSSVIIRSISSMLAILLNPRRRNFDESASTIVF